MMNTGRTERYVNILERIADKYPSLYELTITIEVCIDYGIDIFTDGKTIYIDPTFMDSLNDDELEYIVAHELIHILFDHIDSTGYEDKESYDLACEIETNIFILIHNDLALNSITLSGHGVGIYYCPNGKEAFDMDFDTIYNMICENTKNSVINFDCVGTDETISNNEFDTEDEITVDMNYDTEESEDDMTAETYSDIEFAGAGLDHLFDLDEIKKSWWDNHTKWNK